MIASPEDWAGLITSGVQKEPGLGARLLLCYIGVTERRMMKRIPHGCPKCSVYGSLVLDVQLIAKPVGSFSLAGVQTKFSAEEVPALKCELCGWTKTGRIEGGKAVFGKEKDAS